MRTSRAQTLTGELQTAPAGAGGAGAGAAAGIGTISERPGFDGLPQSWSADDSGQHFRSDRRRATRVQRKFVTQMTPWAAGRPSIPFDVIIDDISETGVGLIHNQPLEMGLRHLLMVPRSDDTPVMLEYVICRCDRRPDGHYSIGLQCAGDSRSALAEEPAPPKRVTSRTTKILFLLFGIFGLIIAAFAPL